MINNSTLLKQLSALQCYLNPHLAAVPRGLGRCALSCLLPRARSTWETRELPSTPTCLGLLQAAILGYPLSCQVASSARPQHLLGLL